MQKVLETLIYLQDIDTQLQRLEAERGDLPQKVKELADEVEEMRNRLAQKIEAKNSLIAEKSSLDNDVILLDEQLKKYKVQLYQVKTNKEYDAITLEIETSEKNKEDKEFRSLELEESIGKISEEIKELEEQLQSQQALLEANKKELDEKLEKTHEQQQQLEEKRKGAAQKLSRQILSTYDRIRKARGGVAVARLIGGACSECSSRIPPQHGLEIRMMNSLNYCEVCGRIVVWTPDSSEE